jgi:alpha-glucosidase (family GH31 glycosyl hydrolase)
MDGWSPERFPNPDAMIAELTNLGFKLGLWQCGPADWIFTSWDLLKRNANEWGVDITNPDDVKKYKNIHNHFYDQGISFFKQDGCGQSEWYPDEPYKNGLTGKEMHNIIPTLYSKIMYEGYKEHTGKRYVNFNPAVGPAQQQYPGIWPSGDSGGGYQMFVGEMNLGMSGHTYTSHDFTDRSPAGIHWSLLGPWMPGALSPAPQGDIPGIQIQNKAPTDASIASMCQLYLKLRYKLIPYIYSTHWQAHKTGTPYMRAMVLEYQDDPITYKLDHQCMLGDWFLLAAYNNDVYLPAGKWFDYWTGEEFKSAGEWKKNHSCPVIVGGPLFVKGGAIIPTGPVMAYVDKEPLKIVVLDIYPFETSAYILYEDDGTTYDYETGVFTTTNFSCRQTRKNILITIGKREGTYGNMPKNRSYLLSVHCQDEPVQISKGTQILIQNKTKEELVSDGTKKGWFYDKQLKTTWIKPMAGWYYAADERGDGDPENDTVYWIDSEKHEEGEFTIEIDLID